MRLPIFATLIILFAFLQMKSQCDSTFIKRLGTLGEDNANMFVPRGDGTYFIAGREENRSLILHVDGSGEIIDQRAFDMTGGNDFIGRLMVDADGYLVGTARDILVGETVNYFFKYDWDNDNFLWVRVLENPAYARFDGLFQNPATGNYQAHGNVAESNNPDTYLVEFDQDTGAPLWQKRANYEGNTDALIDHLIVGQEVYFAGCVRPGTPLGRIRASIFKYDLTGNLDWTKIYFNAVSESARCYLHDLLLENDTIVAISRGDLAGETLTNSTMQMLKTDLDGNFIWAKNYDIPAGNTVLGTNLVVIPGGYIAQGAFELDGFGDLFFMRLQNDGEIVWAKRVGTSADEFGRWMVVEGDQIIFTTSSNGFDPAGYPEILFGKISLDGTVSDGCELIDDIEVTVTDLPEVVNFQAPVSNTEENYDWLPGSVTTEFPDLMTTEIEGCECPIECDTLEIGMDTVAICPGDSVQFAVGGWDEYDWTPAIGLDCPTCAEVTASPDTTTNYVLTVSSVNGCSDSDTVTVLVGTDTLEIFQVEMLCPGDSVEFFTAWLTEAGTYENLDDSGGCVIRNVLTVSLLDSVNFTVEVSSAGCEGEASGQIEVISAQPDLSYSLDGFNFQSNPIFENLPPGNFTVTVADLLHGCASQTEVTLENEPAPTLELPPDLTLELGEIFKIQALAFPSGLVYDWSPIDGLSCTDCLAPIAEPLTSTMYTLTVSTPEGCSAADSILLTVVVPRKVFVPNVFSPNGDGVNDRFTLFAANVAEVRLLRIFDRWGELVFEASNFLPNDPSLGWDGTFRGKPMSPGVFAYHTEVNFVDGTEETLTGDVTLVR